MGFGTFDGLHPGHLSYLEQLRKLGDKVIIVVARDKNVEKIKNKLPHFNEQERIKTIEKTAVVNSVLLGHESDFYNCIKEVKPNIIGLGYDQKADIKEIKRLFPHIRIVRLKAFEPEKNKSSILNNLQG